MDCKQSLKELEGKGSRTLVLNNSHDCGQWERAGMAAGIVVGKEGARQPSGSLVGA